VLTGKGACRFCVDRQNRQFVQAVGADDGDGGATEIKLLQAALDCDLPDRGGGSASD
jgi:hypothetical protein